MPLTKPVRLDPKWWKANYPKSMPANKAIEALIKDFDDRPPTKVGPELHKAIMSAGDSLDYSKLVPDYAKLIDELKRTKALLTKAKHIELSAMMDELVKQVEAEMKGLTKLRQDAEKEKAAKGGVTATKKVVKWDKALEEFTKKFTVRMAKARAEIGRLEHMAKLDAGNKELDKKQRAEALVRLAGISRFVQTTVEALSREMQDDVKTADTAPSDDRDAKKYADAVKAVSGGIPSLLKEAAEVDKKLVAIFIAAFDDATGKKLFAAAKPVAVKL